MLLWFAVFKGAGTESIAGFGQAYYLSYALWGAFFARIATSWMYEFRMVEDVSSGAINVYLVRPMSFYEYYLSQLLGYKFVTTMISLLVPLLAATVFDLPTIVTRIPLAILLCFFYLILVHTISFIISTFAFHLTKVSSFTVAKNLLFWILMGENFPLDLLPEPFKSILITLPFSSGVYLPVGYITGRIPIDYIYQGFVSIGLSLVVLNLIAAYLWKKGMRSYVGTGA